MAVLERELIVKEQEEKWGVGNKLGEKWWNIRLSEMVEIEIKGWIVGVFWCLNGELANG